MTEPPAAVAAPVAPTTAALDFLAITAGIALTAWLLPAAVQPYAYSVVLAAMVYLPVWRLDRRGEPLAAWGLHVKRWGRDLGVALLTAALVFPVYVGGFHGWMTLVHGAAPAYGWPAPALAWTLVEQTLLIALPEEIFYRGWVQGVFERRWPPARRLLGAPYGGAAVLACALFALGHLASVPSPFRLAVFFPGLLFAWLRVRTGGVVAPILLHGMANALNAYLYAQLP